MAKAASSAPADATEGASLYRVVHGWPMLLGLPAPLFLGLTMTGVTAILGGSTLGGLAMAGVATLVVGATWATLAWLFGQDRVALPLALVKRRVALKPVLSSYSPARTRVVLDVDGMEGR